MAARDGARQLFSNVLGLGKRRLAALGIIGATVFGVVALGATYLSGAEEEVLYAGLDRSDVGRIGAALTEAGIGFDVDAAGDTVLVKFGEAGRARMLLAEKGLPNGASAGYELFDELGSLGLTSFMQEVTRVRAMEGEIARTIQLMRGVKAARVHLVLPDEGSFRRDRRPPSGHSPGRFAGRYERGPRHPASRRGGRARHDPGPGDGAEHGWRPHGGR